MVGRGMRELLLSIVGTVAILVGTYLPWAQPNPDHEVIVMAPMVMFDNLHRGYEFDAISYDVLVVAAATLALVALGLTTRQRLRAAATLISGGITLVLCVQFLMGDLVGFTGSWIPVTGWYLTLVGGFLLVLNGGLLTVERLETPLRHQVPTP